MHSPDKTITTRSLEYNSTAENPIFKYSIRFKKRGQIDGSVLTNLENQGQSRLYKYIFETGGSDGYVYFVFRRTVNKVSLGVN